MPRNSKDNSLERFRKMEDIVSRYISAINVEKPFITSSLEIKNKYKESKKYLKNFRDVFFSLSSDDQQILNYCFIEKSSNETFKSQFSNATYYRKRDKAIRAFIEGFSA